MSEPRIVVAGGGLAGLTAALACADAGARVALLESRRRLGGATWSWRRDGLWIDNGQHIFLRCCTAYRDFLHRLGVEKLTTLQSRLSIPVLDARGRATWLRRRAGPAPLHLLGSVLRYRHLSPGDRLRVLRAAMALRRLDPRAPETDLRSFGSWLAEHKQSKAAVERFWNVVVRPTVNVSAASASLALTAQVFQMGLLTEAGASDFGYATVPLDALHAEPAARALASRRVEVQLRSRVTGVAPGEPSGVRVWTRQRSFEADAVVLATPHTETAPLLPPALARWGEELSELGRSPIVNLHVIYDRPVLTQPFVATVGTPLQWVFDRTRASGLARGQYLAVSLSAADEYVGRSSDELRARFVPELERVFPRAREARLESFFVTCEREATFRGLPGTRRLRPPPGTGAERVFLAGAWTDTGWPATMEGAVRSGLAAARNALLAVGVSRHLPREQAA